MGKNMGLCLYMLTLVPGSYPSDVFAKQETRGCINVKIYSIHRWQVPKTETR